MLSNFKTCLHVNSEASELRVHSQFRPFHLPTGEVESKHGEPAARWKTADPSRSAADNEPSVRCLCFLCVRRIHGDLQA